MGVERAIGLSVSLSGASEGVDRTATMAETAQQSSVVREKRPARARVDPELVLTLAGYEVALCLRGRTGARLLAWNVASGALLVALPLLWCVRHRYGGNLVTTRWLEMTNLLLLLFLFFYSYAWMERLARRALPADRLMELLATRACLREIALGKALAGMGVAVLLTLSHLPALALLAAMGGTGWLAAPAVALTLLPGALLGSVEGVGAALTQPRRAGCGSMFVYPICQFVGRWMWSQGGWLRQAMETINPFGAILGAWYPGRTPWATQFAALWLLAPASAILTSRRLGDALPEPTEPGHGTPELHLFSFDPRTFRRRQTAPLDAHNQMVEKGPERPSSAVPDRPSPDYERADPVAAFDRVFGSRLFVHPNTYPLLWVLLAGAWAAALILARLGSPAAGRTAATLTMLFLALFLTCRAGYGMAASIAADREAGRWPFLLLTPLTAPEILAGKARAVLQEDLVLLLFGPAACLAWALFGVLSPGAAAILAGLGTLLPISGLGIGAFLGMGTPSRSEALFRVTLVLLGPPLATVLLASLELDAPIYHLISPLTAAFVAAHSAGDPARAGTAWGSLAIALVVGGLGALHVAGTLRARLGARSGDR